MVQPKTPPLSLRLPPHFIAEIDAWAIRSGLNRHAAMVRLMAKGLAEDSRRSESASRDIDRVEIIQPPIRVPKNPERYSGFTPHPKPGKAKR